MKTKIDAKMLSDVIHDEVAGTGLAFAVVVWVPGFMERGETVTVGMRCPSDVEAADALMKATDQITRKMQDERT